MLLHLSGQTEFQINFCAVFPYRFSHSLYVLPVFREWVLCYPILDRPRQRIQVLIVRRIFIDIRMREIALEDRPQDVIPEQDSVGLSERRGRLDDFGNEQVIIAGIITPGLDVELAVEPLTGPVDEVGVELPILDVPSISDVVHPRDAYRQAVLRIELPPFVDVVLEDDIVFEVVPHEDRLIAVDLTAAVLIGNVINIPIAILLHVLRLADDLLDLRRYHHFTR